MTVRLLVQRLSRRQLKGQDVTTDPKGKFLKKNEVHEKLEAQQFRGRN
jgi:hypothetical protein